MIMRAVQLLFVLYCFQCLLVTKIMNAINQLLGSFGAILRKSETRVTSCGLRVQIYELRVQTHELEN